MCDFKLEPLAAKPPPDPGKPDQPPNLNFAPADGQPAERTGDETHGKAMGRKSGMAADTTAPGQQQADPSGPKIG